MTEDRFEEHLRREAESYHRPPETPREAIWARIEAARRPAPVIPFVWLATGRRRAWIGWAAGLAAALAIGIGIGRWSERQDTVPVRPTAEARRGPGTLPPAAVAEPPEAAGTEAPATSAAPVVAVGEPGKAEPGAGVARRATIKPLQAGREPMAPGARAPAPARDRPAEPRPVGDDIYRFATIQMLTQAEALLTTYRSEPESGPIDARTARWARDVLSSTRLFLDSPATRDPRLRPLLEDLELVLVQIVQLADGPPAPGERAIIDETLENRDVLLRLRTAIPAGTARIGA